MQHVRTNSVLALGLFNNDISVVWSSGYNKHACALADYAYVDSQQPELPYHICVIKDFKMVSLKQYSLLSCQFKWLLLYNLSVCSKGVLYISFCEKGGYFAVIILLVHLCELVKLYHVPCNHLQTLKQELVCCLFSNDIHIPPTPICHQIHDSNLIESHKIWIRKVILNFMQARKESVIAEVKWFYRVTELPEAVYLLLMEDRKNGTLPL